MPKAGRDRLCEWAVETFAGDEPAKQAICKHANTMPKKPPMSLVAFRVPKAGITGTNASVKI